MTTHDCAHGRTQPAYAGVYCLDCRRTLDASGEEVVERSIQFNQEGWQHPTFYRLVGPGGETFVSVVTATGTIRIGDEEDETTDAERIGDAVKRWASALAGKELGKP